MTKELSEKTTQICDIIVATGCGLIVGTFDGIVDNMNKEIYAYGIGATIGIANSLFAGHLQGFNFKRNTMFASVYGIAHVAGKRLLEYLTY